MDTRERIKRLKHIKGLLQSADFDVRTPRRMLIGMFFFGFLCAFAEYWMVPGSLTTACQLLSGGFALGCGFFSLYPHGQTISRLIEQSLADYKPVDQHLYDSLCAEIRRSGFVRRADVAAWLSQERCCVDQPLTRASSREISEGR